MTRLFKYLAITEGYSYLLILFITMPLKRLADIGLPNKIIGMAHGVLFIAYVIIALLVARELKWNIKTLFIVLLMSVIPFGTFWMEEKYLSNQKLA